MGSEEGKGREAGPALERQQRSDPRNKIHDAGSICASWRVEIAPARGSVSREPHPALDSQGAQTIQGDCGDYSSINKSKLTPDSA